MEMNIEFCNAMWRAMRDDVYKNVPRALSLEAWHYIADSSGYNKGHGYKDAEFQIPSVGFYWHGQAWCASDAKCKGWSAYLSHIGVEGY